MSSYHYDEKHLIGNLLSDQDDSFILHSSGSSQSSTKDVSSAPITCSNAVGAVRSEYNSAWPEPPPPYTPSTLFLPPPPGLPVSTWREAPHNVREENVVDDWSSFLAKKTPSYSSLSQRSSTHSAPVTSAPVHNENSMPFSYRDALNRGSCHSMSNSRHGSSSSMPKEGEKNGEEARIKNNYEEVNQDTRSSKGTSSESRDSFQQITRKKGQQKIQNVNGEGKIKNRPRGVQISELMDPPPIEDNSRFTVLDKLPIRRDTSSFSEDEGSFDSRLDRTPMHSTLTKNERKSNIANGTALAKKKWTRKDDRNKCAGIIEHLTILFGMIKMALSYTYSLVSSIFSYVYDLVVDFIINLFALSRYGMDRARVEMRMKMHEARGKASEWWNRRKEEEEFGLIHNIRMPDTADQALERLLHARGQDAYSVLGLRWDESDEVIKSYYKRQALLVHPDKNKADGAAEAFQILSKAFEVISTPDSRKKYDEERMMTDPLRKEFTELYRVLQVKVEETRNRMDCNCGMTHVRVACRLPQQAARYCKKCDTRHAAKNLDLWAESRFLGYFWLYYTCVNGVIYDVTAWANCSFNHLKHIKADQHNVQYRMANVKKDKEPRQTDRYHERVMNESTEKTTAIHLNGGSNHASLQPIAREEDRPRKAKRAVKKK